MVRVAISRSEFFDIPHEFGRTDDDPFDIFSISGHREPLAERDIWDDLERPLLNLNGQLFARCGIIALDPFGAQGLNSIVAWPAEPSGSAVSRERQIRGGIEHLGTGKTRRDDAPATFIDWFLRCAATDQRTPVIGNKLNVEIKFFQNVVSDKSKYVKIRLIDAVEDDNLFTLIAGFSDHLLCLGVVTLAGESFRSRSARHGRATGEERRTYIPVFRIARDRSHEFALVDHGHNGPTQLFVVEWRLQVVEPQYAHRANRIVFLHRNLHVGLENGSKIRGHFLPPIDLAAAERRGGSRMLGDVEPFDAVDFRDLAAGRPTWGLLPGDVLGILHVDVFVAGLEFTADHLKRTGADRFLHLLVRVSQGHSLRHDEWNETRNFGEPRKQKREWFL